MVKTLSEYLKDAQNRLDYAISEHSIPFVWVAYSGGSDSAVIVELLRQLNVPVSWGVMTIDTGLSSIGHIDRIRSDIKRAGLSLSIFTGQGLDWYIDNVSHYGFAYTPNQHSIYYRSLKERAIDDSIRSVKTKYHQRILTVTGVRRAESYKRSQTPILYHKRGARVTLNLIADYNDTDKNVILSNVHWYGGKTTEDCMCNWHCNYKNTDRLNSLARAAVNQVDSELRSCGAWGYGEKPTSAQVSMFSDVRSDIENMPDDSMCVNCISGKMWGKE